MNEIERCLIAMRARRADFRVVQFSVQGDHIHLFVEAADRDALARGMQGLAIRLARGFNRVVDRSGKVWGDRYHARELTTPREVRNGLVYVLMNHKKHGLGTHALDRWSSALWFDGFEMSTQRSVERLRERALRGGRDSPVSAPRTWLANVGWRRHGVVGPDERPRL